MNSFENGQVECPFYNNCKDIRIYCEGIKYTTKLTLTFKNKQKRIAYMTDFCFCGCWRGCSIAQAIERDYEECLME